MYMAYFPLLPFAPLFSPSLLTWNPPCCDRIHPPRSQVAHKLTSPFPHLAHIPSHPKSRPPGVFQIQIYIIRTTLRTQPISSRTLTVVQVYCNIMLLFRCKNHIIIHVEHQSMSPSCFAVLLLVLYICSYSIQEFDKRGKDNFWRIFLPTDFFEIFLFILKL